MTGKTHIMGGIASCTAAAYYYGFDPVLMAASGAVGALIPDICHTQSKIGRRFPILSKAVSSVFGHRTFTHSLLFLLIMFFITATYIPNKNISTGLMIGMASHLILDAWTVNGIKLLFPSTIRVRLPLYMKTGSFSEQLVLAGLTIASCYYFYMLFYGRMF
ncbi:MULTISPECIES: metal-dependent hydrolase [Bacillus]|uniref:metal-dependent hydrolase n=1 Tax=Bacillus TaxID=1386 RepID=UPI001E4B51CA|nr:MULTISPECIES: metal-dependent hydrolase [Bacillus]MCE0738429.1 metal-dependent hydrolase [Bacillus sp. G16]MCY8853555.1 metal-dependent hydrolase [Bacillus inaquosorum]